MFPAELGRFIYWVPVLELLKIFAQNLYIYNRNDSTLVCIIHFIYILVLEDVIGSDVGGSFLWPTLYNNSNSNSNSNNNNNNIIIIISKTMFMVLSSWQIHCESSPGSFECRMAPSGRRPKTKPDDLGCESACTGCQNLHPPSPVIIITQPESNNNMQEFMWRVCLC